MSDMYDDLSIVDAHHHLWDLEGHLRYPWLTSGEHSYMGDYAALRRTYEARAIAALTELDRRA